MRCLAFVLCFIPLCASAQNLNYHLYTTTSDGVGADATVGTAGSTSGTSSSLSVRNNVHTTHWRIAYLRFDLRQFKRNKANLANVRRPVQAFLALNVCGKHPMMYKGWTFNVYGLKEKAKYGQNSLNEMWDERAINWENAPANAPRHGGGAHGKEKVAGGLLQEHVVHLGVFRTPRHRNGRVVFSSPELLKFIAKDKNRIVTLIITRIENDDNPISFSTKESKGKNAPMLALRGE